MITPTMSYALLQDFINAGLKNSKSAEDVDVFVGFGEGIKHEEENWGV